MTNEPDVESTDPFEDNLYTSCLTRERTLNEAITLANISESFEQYLEIFDEFYADDLQVAGETDEQPIHGKAQVRSMIANFLVPLHAMAEIGGLSVSIRHTAFPGDAADETHSFWTLEIVGTSGRSCTVSWRALRKWNGSRVVYEYHYDHQQMGGPLTSEDLDLYAPASATADQRPS
jgi:hypothetical protein